MRSTSTWKINGILWVLLLLLVGLILCPLITVFARAVIIDGRLDLSQAWSIIFRPSLTPFCWAYVLSCVPQ